MQQVDGVVARRATLEEIFQVRWDVLRPGRPIERVRFPGEEGAETIHVGAFAGERNIGCATFMPAAWDGQAAWQLRGLGVADGWQGRGVGQMILAEGEELVRGASEVRLIWCNAREEAIGFYKRQGWVVASERFHVEDVGPHYKMTKRI